MAGPINHLPAMLSMHGHHDAVHFQCCVPVCKGKGELAGHTTMHDAVAIGAPTPPLELLYFTLLSVCDTSGRELAGPCSWKCSNAVAFVVVANASFATHSVSLHLPLQAVSASICPCKQPKHQHQQC
jgi:hypothetical protein